MTKTLILIGMVLVIALLAFMGGCATSSQDKTQPTQALNGVDVAATMMMVNLGAQATKQAADMQVVIINSQYTATAAVAASTSTAEQRRIDVASTAQARQDVAATAEQHRGDMQATQVVLNTQTAVANTQTAVAQSTVDAKNAYWFGQTQMAVPTSDYLTQVANNARVVETNNNIEKSNLDLDAKRKGNMVQTFGPWVALFMVIIIVAVVANRQSRTKVFKNDETGVIDGILLDNEKFIKPKLLPAPVIALKSMTAPAMTSQAEQSEVNKRAQLVEALEAMPTMPPTQNASDLMASVFGQRNERRQRFDILDEGDLPPAGLLDAESVKAMDSDWKEARDE